jgi:O-acetyl-ADP-ribose deacetylase (regulator of RNase III)
MIEVRLEAGDIIRTQTDAVVCPANTDLWMGSGVAGAIKLFGGTAIEDEAMRQGPMARGEAVITGAGKLRNCRYVIHAAAMGGPEWIPSPVSIHDATFNSLKRADGHSLASVVIPALGTGNGSFPLAAAARLMAAAVRDFETTHPESSLRTVTFQLRDPSALAEFERGLP